MDEVGRNSAEREEEDDICRLCRVNVDRHLEFSQESELGGEEPERLATAWFLPFHQFVRIPIYESNTPKNCCKDLSRGLHRLCERLATRPKLQSKNHQKVTFFPLKSMYEDSIASRRRLKADVSSCKPSVRDLASFL